MLLWNKPKCELVVSEGKRGAWRWTAYSTKKQNVAGKMFEVDDIIAVCSVRGFVTSPGAKASGEAAMIGWNIVNIEFVKYSN